MTQSHEKTTDKRTILVVEDDGDLLRVAIRVLKLHGYEVHGATDCTAAMAMVAEHDIDLLLTDVHMPGMCGDELAARLAASHPEIRVLFTSGYPNEAPAPAHGRANGAMADTTVGVVERKHFIEKPYAMSDLARRVEEVFAADPPAH